MGYVQLSNDLKAIVEQQVTDERAASEADFLAEAVRLYAGYLSTDQEIAVLIERTDADMAVGRHVIVSPLEGSEAIHQRTLNRSRTNVRMLDNRRLALH